MSLNSSLNASKQPFMISIKSLPSDFAYKVLDLEGSLGNICELETVQSLLALYTSAIEYYESQGDPRYLHYKERIHLLLSRQDVVYMLKHPDSGPISHRSSYMKHKLEAQKRSFSKSLNKTSKLKMSRCAEKAFQLHKTESVNALKKMQENLKSQCSLLEVRVKERSKRQKSVDLDTDAGSTFGGVEALNATFDAYEEQVEGIIERFHQEKEDARRRIEAKFEEQIEEISELDDFTNLDCIIDEMRAKMKGEIKQEIQAIENKKKKKINHLRQNF